MQCEQERNEHRLWDISEQRDQFAFCRPVRGGVDQAQRPFRQGIVLFVIVPIEAAENFFKETRGIRTSEEILQLPEKYKTVIYLYYYESFTLKEIADTLKKSINTVSSELQRARKKLKKILTEEELPYEEK